MNREITDGIYYIGVDDHDLRYFENQYHTPQGVSYNSYLLRGEKVAVVDTSDARTGALWLGNVREVLGGSVPDYLVVEHLEPDHSGVIGEFLKLYPDVQIVLSAVAAKMLPQFFEVYPENVKTLVMKEGDSLDLGGLTMKFTMAPMVHWPEVMMAYVPERKLLFSADAFGTFGTLDTQRGNWADEARRYYLNIVGKYGQQVQNLLKKVSAFDIEIICPLHGSVLKGDLAYYIGLYDKWSRYVPETGGVLVACASIHGNTRNAADYLAQRLIDLGVKDVTVADLTRDDMSWAVAEAFRNDRLVLCAASYDAGLFTPMHTFLHSLQAKGLRDRTVALVENGSWAPSAARVMTSMLSEMKDMRILPETVTIRTVVKPADRLALDRLAESLTHNP